ncbi:MAG: hypothetical protein M3Y33_10245 [Actinomycetota bacterium]|nr:hypothetical protein [Actinomycetota bacterium]
MAPPRHRAGLREQIAAATRTAARMKDLDITIAACLTSHALNIGYGPVVKKGAEALERDRTSTSDAILPPRSATAHTI